MGEKKSKDDKQVDDFNMFSFLAMPSSSIEKNNDVINCEIVWKWMLNCIIGCYDTYEKQQKFFFLLSLFYVFTVNPIKFNELNIDCVKCSDWTNFNRCMFVYCLLLLKVALIDYRDWMIEWLKFVWVFMFSVLACTWKKWQLRLTLKVKFCFLWNLLEWWLFKVRWFWLRKMSVCSRWVAFWCDNNWLNFLFLFSKPANFLRKFYKTTIIFMFLSALISLNFSFLAPYNPTTQTIKWKTKLITVEWGNEKSSAQ